jgi:hypothetical protein
MKLDGGGFYFANVVVLDENNAFVGEVRNNFL